MIYPRILSKNFPIDGAGSKNGARARLANQEASPAAACIIVVRSAVRSGEPSLQLPPPLAWPGPDPVSWTFNRSKSITKANKLQWIK